MTERKRAKLISFSGMDGSGKSTQIEHACALLRASGRTVRVLAFWDDVVVLCRYREGFVHKVYGSERGIGAPGKPVERRDKNVRRWYLTLARHGLYFLDALHLWWVVRRARASADVLILDRYIYDELANLPLESVFTCAYIRVVQAVVPRPDVALVLDADPETARARKPEYPVDFMHKCRAAYLVLTRLLGNISVIPPLPLEEAKAAVTAAVLGLSTTQASPAPSEMDAAPAA